MNMRELLNVKKIIIQQFNVPGKVISGLMAYLFILLALITSCKSDSFDTDWFSRNSLSISNYVEANKKEFSKFHKLMLESKLLNTLYGYNPYGNDYTLFLPTDKAIENYIGQNPKYSNFEELVRDTGFIKKLVRYHIVNSKVHTDEFPDGALLDRTLTNDRLVTGFYTDGTNQIILINNTTPVTKSNMLMTNGYIHIISEVLQKQEISGYDLLQKLNGYSILAEVIRLSGVRSRLWWSKYTILAEHDSIYRKKGIQTAQDLIARIATPGMQLSNQQNKFHLFAAYHFVGGEYYVNDLEWGSNNYATLATGKPLTVDVGIDLKINPGIDTYIYTKPNTGETIAINYIRPIWEKCNIMTTTGPIHSISDLLFYEPIPKK
jgi:uncharacterized surface protein with fasciclin (FAS1) repeats